MGLHTSRPHRSSRAYDSYQFSNPREAKAAFTFRVERIGEEGMFSYEPPFNGDELAARFIVSGSATIRILLRSLVSAILQAHLSKTLVVAVEVQPIVGLKHGVHELFEAHPHLHVLPLPHALLRQEVVDAQMAADIDCEIHSVRGAVPSFVVDHSPLAQGACENRTLLVTHFGSKIQGRSICISFKNCSKNLVSKFSSKMDSNLHNLPFENQPLLHPKLEDRRTSKFLKTFKITPPLILNMEGKCSANFKYFDPSLEMHVKRIKAVYQPKKLHGKNV